MNLLNTHSTPDDIAWRIARTTFVIVVRGDDDKYNLIVDPGLNKPWSTTLRKLADTVARECDGMVCTYDEALKLLIKDNPLFEKSLYDRLAQKAKIIDAEQMKHNAVMINEILAKDGGKNLSLPPTPKNDVNPINPEY